MHTSRTRSLVAVATAAVAVSAVTIALVPSTTAGFVDSTYAQTTLTGELSLTPVPYDQSSGTGLFLTPTGDLYMTGQRSNGNGAGGTATATDPPSKVTFPAGTVITDAIGSTDGFENSAATSWAAIDSTGRIWTWGRPLGGEDYIGRGDITAVQARTPAVVLPRPGQPALPRFIDLQRAENQFFALDATGRMWAWGYDGQNLPLSNPNPDNRSYPTVVDQVAVAAGAANCTGANAGGSVSWHSIWSGNNAGSAVSTSGLVYTWGFDHGRLDGVQVNQRCPILNEQANRALFQAYPDVYRTAAGQVYDERVLLTEPLRLARYNEIVLNMRSTTLASCAAPLTKSTLDASGCPVRQLAYGARAPRMLLANGDLYTWQVSADLNYGAPFLGRASTSNTWSVDGSRYKATVALRGVDHFASGIGHVRALMHDGRVLGWGRNADCQAIGIHSNAATPCTTRVDSEIVTLPTHVANQPSGVSRLAAAACVSWMLDADGSMWGSGAANDGGYNYVLCGNVSPIASAAYDQTPPNRTAAAPYGLRLTQNMGVQRLR